MTEHRDQSPRSPAKGSVSDVVAAKVRQARKERGWSSAALAARTDGRITDNMLENIETGRPHDGVRSRIITAEELLVLAGALGVSPAALMPDLGTPECGITLEAARIIDAAIGQLEDLKAWYTHGKGQRP